MRALQLLIAVSVAAGVVTIPATVARAAPAICDEGGVFEEPLVSLPPVLLRSPAPAQAGPPAAPVTVTVGGGVAVAGDDEPAREQCRPGFDNQAGCRPYQPLPAPGRTAGPLAVESFVLVRPPAVPPPASCGIVATTDAADRLPSGFSRRIDRPPRAR